MERVFGVSELAKDLRKNMDGFDMDDPDDHKQRIQMNWLQDEEDE